MPKREKVKKEQERKTNREYSLLDSRLSEFFEAIINMCIASFSRVETPRTYVRCRYVHTENFGELSNLQDDDDGGNKVSSSGSSSSS
jgi:hypothetical protein